MLPTITIDPNINQAETLPSDFYLNENIFEESKEKIFTPSWQFVTNHHSLDNINVFPFTFLKGYIDEPLLLINNGDCINCYSNVCTHRAHLVATEPCKVNKLRCPYHGRTYNLDGTFNSMTCFETVENFPTEKDNLQSIPTLQWNQFIFASLNPKIDITPVLKDVEMRLPQFPFDQLTYDIKNSTTWEINAHWALYCENYLEGFHVPFVHKGLAKEIDVGTYETQLLENGVLQIAECEKELPILKDPKTPNRNIYGLYYWIFPNIMLNFYSWGLSVNIIEPISLVKTRVRFLSYPIFSNKQPIGKNSSVDTVELEDQSIIQNVQKGVKSRFYNTGRYSPEHEKGVHYFQRLISMVLT